MRPFGELVQVNHQCYRVVPVVFVYPAHDEFLRILVEVLLMEWRWVHRIEKLIQVAQVQLNPMVLQRVSPPVFRDRCDKGKWAGERFCNIHRRPTEDTGFVFH